MPAGSQAGTQVGIPAPLRGGAAVTYATLPGPESGLQALGRAVQRLDRAALPLGLLALALLAIGMGWGLDWRLGPPPVRAATFALYAGGMLLGVVLAARALALAQRHRRRALMRLYEHDPVPCFATDAAGHCHYLNAAARMLPRVEAPLPPAEAVPVPASSPASVPGRAGAPTPTLLQALATSFAAPATARDRLLAQARSHGSAREDVRLRRGHRRVSVHRIDGGAFLWRLEEFSGRDDAEATPAQLALPMLTASAKGRVLYLNPALRALLGWGPARPDAPEGAEGAAEAPLWLESIFADLPLRPGRVHRLRAPTGNLRARLAEFAGPTGRRELYLLPVVGEDDAADWSLAEDFPVPMLRLSAQGLVLMANHRAGELLGPLPAQGRPLADLVEGLGRSITDWLADAAQGEGLRQPEVVRALRDDREVYLQIRLGRLQQAGAPQLVAVLSDLTELKTLEAQFVQSQKMQAIGQLAGGVAHDFNNLLTAITGHCDLLLLRHEDATDPDHGDLQQISQNANRAAALVGQLLAFSRKQNLQPQALDLREVLGDLAHLLNRLVGERVKLVLAPTPDLLPIRADRRQFEQVVVNLVVNARDAMPEGGEIHVSAAVTTLPAPFQRDRATVPQGDWVVVRVRDQGAGIPDEQLAKLFEPFFTTKRPGEGTGLGLSTAYGIVKQSGGFIFADSAPGAGSEFQVWLPLHRGRPEAPGASSAPPTSRTRPDPAPAMKAALAALSRQPSTTPETGAETAIDDANPAKPASTPSGMVLLVEDEAPVRAFASRALRLQGHTVLEAGSGEEALELLQDPGLQVEVFVTDVVMPGLDGPSWVAQALRARPAARVVFVSGYAEDSVAEHQSRIPGAVFLQKPFSLLQLTETVAAQMA